MTFPGPAGTLRGVLHRPPGAGRLPAVIWNHGSERQPAPQLQLAKFYGSRGYCLFLPHRHGHGRSPGDYFAPALLDRARTTAGDAGAYQRRIVELVIALHECQLADTVAAVEWLRGQAFVDAARVAMSGVSFGGVQTLLAAEADVGLRAYVPFAPAAIAWDGSPALRERLLRAVERAAAPILLVQAGNDHSLGPSEILGTALKRKGSLNRAHVYPPYGSTRDAGHGAFACEGTEIWGDQVCEFLDDALDAAKAVERSGGCPPPRAASGAHAIEGSHG